MQRQHIRLTQSSGGQIGSIAKLQAKQNQYIPILRARYNSPTNTTAIKCLFGKGQILKNRSIIRQRKGNPCTPTCFRKDTAKIIPIITLKFLSIVIQDQPKQNSYNYFNTNGNLEQQIDPTFQSSSIKNYNLDSFFFFPLRQQSSIAAIKYTQVNVKLTSVRYQTIVKADSYSRMDKMYLKDKARKAMTLQMMSTSELVREQCISISIFQGQLNSQFSSILQI